MLRKHLTYANVMSSAAVFAVLGGTAFAATQLPRDSVGAREIRAGAVRSAEVRDGSLTLRDFRAGQLPALRAGGSVAGERQSPVAGERGPQGERGPAGERGPRGEQGPAGKDAPGRLVNLRRVVSFGDSEATVPLLDLPGIGPLAGRCRNDWTTALTLENEDAEWVDIIGVQTKQHSQGTSLWNSHLPNGTKGTFPGTTELRYTLQLADQAGGASALLEIGAYISGTECHFLVNGQTG